MKNSDGVVESGIWIGFHDLAEEDQWQWVDGSGGPDSYTLVNVFKTLLSIKVSRFRPL